MSVTHVLAAQIPVAETAEELKAAGEPRKGHEAWVVTVAKDIPAGTKLYCYSDTKQSAVYYALTAAGVDAEKLEGGGRGNRALKDRIAELEAQLAAAGSNGKKGK